MMVACFICLGLGFIAGVYGTITVALWFDDHRRLL
jgi:hypothetical protein